MHPRDQRNEARLRGEKSQSCPFERRIRLVDSLLFAGASLDAMVQDLNETASKHQLPLRKAFPTCYQFAKANSYDEKMFKLMTSSKMNFPYEVCSSWESMCNIRTPPPANAFASSLRDSPGLTTSEHEEFCQIWEVFKIDSLASLLIFYNKLDTMLTADTCLFLFNRLHHITKIFPTHVFTISSLAIESALLNSRHPDKPWKPLFIPFLETEIYDRFCGALNGNPLN